MHRAVLLAGDEVITEAAIVLPRAEPAPGSARAASPVGADDPANIGRTVADVERQLIIDTVQHCLGNRTHAATILGISIRTLRNKLKQYQGEGFNVPPAGPGSQPIA